MPKHTPPDPRLRLDTESLMFDYVTYDVTRLVLRYARARVFGPRGGDASVKLAADRTREVGRGSARPRENADDGRGADRRRGVKRKVGDVEGWVDEEGKRAIEDEPGDSDYDSNEEGEEAAEERDQQGEEEREALAEVENALVMVDSLHTLLIESLHAQARPRPPGHQSRGKKHDPSRRQNRIQTQDPAGEVQKDAHTTHHPQPESEPPPSAPTIPSTLLFRLTLLRFTTLFVLRHSINASSPPLAALENLRVENRRRAAGWGRNLGGKLVFPESVIRWYRGFGGVVRLGTDSWKEREGKEHGAVVVESVEKDTAPMGSIEADEDAGLDAGLDVEHAGDVGDVVMEEADRGSDSRPNSQSHSPQSSLEDSDSSPRNQPAQPHLLDLIPLFASLTAQRAAEDAEWSTTPAWLELAAEMMLQGVLEAYQVHGEAGSTALVEGFAWGVEGMSSGKGGHVDVEERSGDAARGGTVDAAVNTVFLIQGDTQSPEQDSATWAGLRDEYMTLFLPPNADDEVSQDWRTEDHLIDLASRRPRVAFDRMMCRFLEAMCESCGVPILRQLEAQEGVVEVDGEELEEDDVRLLRRLLLGERA